MNTNNINKQQKPVEREEKILKQKQNKPGTILEITKLRNMCVSVSISSTYFVVDVLPVSMY
jgi:hypothetical protein